MPLLGNPNSVPARQRLPVFWHKFFRLIGWIAGICGFVIFFSGVVPAGYALRASCGLSPLPAERGVLHPESEREEVWTYLTVPEWFIVYSADEYGHFLNENRPSQFPYFSSISQYWRYYHSVYCATKDAYVFDRGYHFVLFVIGTSFTAEQSLKGLYEGTIGRISEWTAGNDQTDEDFFARNVARDYGAFIHTIPWYEFPFSEKLSGLWTDTSVFGRHMIRKWERKLFLSAEYGIKTIYSWVIKKGTGATYEPERLLVGARIEPISEDLLRTISGVSCVETAGDFCSSISIPRYEAFTKIVPILAARGVRFIEIAGNDDIAATLQVPRDWVFALDKSESLFDFPLLSDPLRKRVLVRIPVSSLHSALREFAGDDVLLEHLYDY